MGEVVRFRDRHELDFCTAIGADPRAPEPAVDPAWTLEASLRSYLAVDAALDRWSDSALIAVLLQSTDPAERDAVLAELTERVK